MKVKQILIKQVKNLGNYQSKTVELVAEVAEGEDTQCALQLLQAEIESFLNPSIIKHEEEIEPW